MRTKLEYPVLVEPLPPEDGGGFLATVPDLPGCMSDGETPEEALANIRNAVEAWIEEARALGRSVPTPTRRHVAAAE
jgi:predicted RNase H-like HicB family nuclease